MNPASSMVQNLFTTGDTEEHRGYSSIFDGRIFLFH